ncbi:hypothetical protein [Pseudoalteromonas sp. S558]|uniref:hypothetical protein n=1 Tax=Pseudoalteromonas sp. S558 TaxID=2066515 RepID=UPI00110AA1F5|nr:hypothetical protein [Pseudoalteromonas sp. S558]TMO03501.1 hypothetical protein CWB66_10600 [Pseudoalteromonas sp. S558]
MLTLVLCLFLNSVLVMFFCVVVCSVAGLFVWRKTVASHPMQGVVILESNLFRFESDSLKIQGEINYKSRIIGNSVWLYIKGFSNNRWLIISANSVNEQSYTRLKRATLSAINRAADSK